MNLPFRFIFILCAFFIVPITVWADEPTTQKAEATDEESKYTQMIDKRADDIIALLDISEAAKSTRVHNTLTHQYRALRDWQSENDKKSADAKEADAFKKSMLDKRKILHDAFLAKLAEDLSPEQIEKVKDKMVYGKVEFTFKGYQIEYPNLTEEQNAKVLEFLKQAREEAMDGTSSKEKDNIFNKYKGKINNYLSKQGVVGKKKAATTKPASSATQPDK